MPSNTTNTKRWSDELILTMMMFGCRREKLWIAMEYCGGGSMQDIYHGKLVHALSSFYTLPSHIPPAYTLLAHAILAHILCLFTLLLQAHCWFIL